MPRLFRLFHGRSPGRSKLPFMDMVRYEPLEPRRYLSTAPMALSDDVGVIENAAAFSLIGLAAFYNDPRFADIDGNGFAIAVLDTGIDRDHPFFGADANADGVADRIIFQHDFADNDGDASDFSGHGSNIASLIASQDGTYPGVAQGVNLIILKVFPSDGGIAPNSAVEAALQWVRDNASTYNIAAVNLSFGVGRFEQPHEGPFADELADLAAAGVLAITSGGNDFFTSGGLLGVSYPAADPNTIAVGAVWSKDSGGPFQFADGAIDISTGPDRILSFTSRHPELLDITAPGALLAGADADGGVGVGTGSSQASAIVSGVAVLAQQLAIRELGRRLTFEEFSHLIRATGKTINDGDNEEDNVPNTGFNFQRIDVMELAEGILGLVPPPAHLEVSGAGNPIEDGDTTPAAADGTHFGSVTQNAAPPQRAFVVTNTGGQNLTIGPVQIDGGFEIVQSLPASLAPGASATLIVRLSTATVGDHFGTVRFSTNAPLVGEFDFLLAGTVLPPPAPEITVLLDAATIPDGLSEPIEFGAVTLGKPGPTRTFVIQNDGNADLVLGTLISPEGFTILDPLAESIAPGGSDTLILQLNSDAIGTKLGEVKFATNDSDEPQFNFNVTGSVVPAPAPDIQIKLGTSDIVTAQPQAIDFGNAVQGDAAITLTFTLVNTGNALLSLGAVSVPGGFSLVQAPPATLGAGQSASIRIAMTTAAVGAHAGEVSISSNDPDENPFVFNVSGQVAAAPAPVVTVLEAAATIGDGQTTPIDFGTTPQGGDGVTRAFTVRNDGNAILTLGPVVLPDGFTLVEGLSGSLAPGESDTFTVLLDPSTLGAKSGQIRFLTNDPDVGEFTFAITGTVTAAPLPFVEVRHAGAPLVDGQAAAVDFGAAAPGSDGPTRTFTVHNSGTAPLVIGTLSVPAGYSIVQGLPSSIAPGGSASFTLKLDTSISGTRTGRVELTTNDAARSPFDFAVTGLISAAAPAIVLLGESGAPLGNGTPIDFGTLLAGEESSYTITVRNAGNSPLALGAIAVPSGFLMDRSNLPQTLAAGASGTIVLRLDPAAPGIHSGTFSIGSNDTNRPSATLSLMGTVLPPAGVFVQSVEMNKVPARVVGGTGKKSTIKVRLVNNGDARVKGRAQVRLFASMDATVQHELDLMLAELSKKIDLKPGKSKSIKLKAKFHAPPQDGDYLLIATVTGAGVSGNIEPATTAERPVFIERPNVALVPHVAGSDPAALKVNKSKKLKVRFGNEGNVRAKGRADFDLFLTPDGNPASAGTISLGTLKRVKIDIKNNSTKSIKLKVKLPKGIVSGDYVLVARMRMDSALAQNSASGVIEIPLTIRVA
jgi:hypothetical protein